MRLFIVGIAAGAAIGASRAFAVDISLHSAWMRPAPTRSTAKAYVDIASDTPLRLTRASSPMAGNVEIVVVERTDGSDPGRPVASFPIAANGLTRFAYLGNHLRLVDVKEPLGNGSAVPIALEFRDEGGIAYVVFTSVEVRGLVAPGPAR
jgi:copper(I)-binding protein